MTAVLETVLAMSFRPGSLQSLQMLHTLAAQPVFAARLLEVAKFEGVISVVDIQTQHADFHAATQALRVIDAVMLHGSANGALSIQQITSVLQASERVASAKGVDEAALAAVTHTVTQAQMLLRAGRQEETEGDGHAPQSLVESSAELSERFARWEAKNLQPGTPSRSGGESSSSLQTPVRKSRGSRDWRRLSNT